jgi:hypothetical protein
MKRHNVLRSQNFDLVRGEVMRQLETETKVMQASPWAGSSNSMRREAQR